MCPPWRGRGRQTERVLRHRRGHVQDKLERDEFRSPYRLTAEVRANLPPLVMAGLRPGHPASTLDSCCMEGLDGRLKGGHDESGEPPQHEGVFSAPIPSKINKLSAHPDENRDRLTSQ